MSISRDRMILLQFCQAGLKLKPSKCHFFETQVTYRGHVLTPDRVLPDPDNVEKIKTWPVPTCVTDVWVILGMGNYYWQFIKDYSKKMQSLIQLKKKDKSFEWTAEFQKSFDQKKEALTGPDIMAYQLMVVSLYLTLMQGWTQLEQCCPRSRMGWNV